EYNAITMTDHALAFIDRNKERPFLLMLSIDPPHSNFFDAPPRFRVLYEGKDLARRPNFEQPLKPGFDIWSSNGLHPDKVHYGYLAHISAVDHEIGRILGRLDELRLAANTVVVYSSDHGEMLGSHGRMGKRQPFEESIRVPFVVRWKEHIQPAMRPKTLIGAIDFMPTIAGLAGVQIPDGLDGRDLSGVLRGEKIDEPAYQPIMHIFRDLAAVANHPAEIFRGVRTKRFTYAATVARHFVLYDLEKDPYQRKNLINDPAYAGELERLQRLT
ncbi:MAG: sulfatase-like hydrolase/transferase, partial [bacterium]|nr:sulfatase-like hydrolase/transferase [bacterium]